MLRVVSQPFCEVLMLDRWDAEPSRYFTAYSAHGATRWILGHPVIDEFATISSPIFITPRSLLGKIYNAGLSLGHKRDPEMGIDQGWPPLCVGLDVAAPKLPTGWEDQLLDGVTSNRDLDERPGERTAVRRGILGYFEVECLRLGEATIAVTSAPLLPKQLSFLCQAASSPVAVAVSVGNRLEPVADGAPRSVEALSQRFLGSLYGVVEELCQ